MSIGKPRKKNLPLSTGGHALVVWGIVVGLTALRLHTAFSGNLNDHETFLSVCALHPQGAYVEGPAGVPLLLAASRMLFGSGLMALRWLSPIAVLLLSWCLWWLARRSFPRSPSLALWSLLGINLLPSVNLASLVMDGAMVTAALILLTVAAGWNAVTSERKKEFINWIYFGLLLGIGTLFFAPVGLLLPLAFILRFLIQQKGKNEVIPWRGFLMALGLLVLGWIAPLVWNARHDWIQWSSVAQGFESYAIGGTRVSFALVVASSALLVPLLVRLSFSGAWWRRAIILLFLGMGIMSAVILLMPEKISGISLNLPSPLGVRGVDDLSRTVISLQKERPDARGQKPFLIAENSDLAAILGAKISSNYPECPGAPPVFVAESPSLNSSYALWPSYANAVAPGMKDILYTDEKTVSPFLGRNAFYITTELPGELPQTITGAFGAVGLFQEVPLIWNGCQISVRIYQCEGYRSLAL